MKFRRNDDGRIGQRFRLERLPERAPPQIAQDLAADLAATDHVLNSEVLNIGQRERRALRQYGDGRFQFGSVVLQKLHAVGAAKQNIQIWSF